MQRITKNLGRIELFLDWINVGNDYLILLRGGEEHIGSSCMAYFDSFRNLAITSVMSVPEHKEEEIANNCAKKICESTKKTTVFVAGIHLDNITKKEIQDIVDASYYLVDKLISILEENN